MRLARPRKGEAVPKGPNDGSQARSAWESAIKEPSRRVRYDWLLFRRFGCARRLLLRGNPSRRTLRDGFVIERHSRHHVPGYHRSVPPGRRPYIERHSRHDVPDYHRSVPTGRRPYIERHSRHDVPGYHRSVPTGRRPYIERHSRHDVPGYHHSVPPGRRPYIERHSRHDVPGYHRSVPPGRRPILNVIPGTTCLATIIQSLRDGGPILNAIPGTTCLATIIQSLRDGGRILTPFQARHAWLPLFSPYGNGVPYIERHSRHDVPGCHRSVPTGRFAGTLSCRYQPPLWLPVSPRYMFSGSYFRILALR